MNAAARQVAILHAALVLGVILVGAVFFFLLRTMTPAFPRTSMLVWVTAGIGLGNIAAALGFFRPRIPQRRSDQAPDDYWISNEIRAMAIVLWAMLEGGALLAWVGYLLTGAPVPAGVGVLAIAALILVRPSRLEGEAN